MTQKEIRKWYHDHGMKFEHEDWGPRDENGESIGGQTQETERSSIGDIVDGKKVNRRTTSVRSADPTPPNQWWWEDKHLPWPERSHAEQLWVENLDLFFEPYLLMMPVPKAALIRSVINDRSTYTEVAGKSRSRQAAQQQTARALRALTLSIALDDPDFTKASPRDYQDEAVAAWRVFKRFSIRKGYGG